MSFTRIIAQPTEQNTMHMIVFLSPENNESLGEDEQLRIENEHLRSLSRWLENGILANAGPFEGGGELILLNTSSRSEAEMILQSDPAINNHLMSAEILGITIRKGAICNPTIPYEMKTYGFIRYTPTNQIASFKTNQDLEMKRVHQKFIESLTQTGNVILEGTFQGNDGGILIYSGRSLNDKIRQDPAIQEGYLKADIRTIWLNKGSFCEN